jgi:fructose-1,6-bisphosphatase/inositol monophosphatase family enzyme
VQDERPALLEGLRAIAGAQAQVRSFGSGSLELAWVAAGRLGAWVQVRPARWDWLPGAVLVEQAGGTAAALDGRTGWHVAAARDLHAELARLLAAGRPPGRPARSARGRPGPPRHEDGALRP